MLAFIVSLHMVIDWPVFDGIVGYNNGGRCCNLVIYIYIVTRSPYVTLMQFTRGRTRTRTRTRPATYRKRHACFSTGYM